MAVSLPRLRLENPVLTKELRTRMRGARAYWILFVYLLLLSLILFFSYLSWWQGQRRADEFGGGQEAFAVGKLFYLVVLGTQSVLVGLITPALTAGAISLEREQRTYEMLTVSLLPRRAIVAGKLWAAVGFVALLLTAGLPLVSLCFLLGGVSPGEVFSSYGLLLVVAFLYGTVGVAWSAITRRTATATVLSYGTILLMFVLTLPLAAVGFSRPFGGPALGSGLGALNPVGAVFSGSLSEQYFGLVLPAWVPALVLNGLLGVILMAVATHRLEYPATDRSGLLRVLSAVFVGLAAFFVYGFLLPQQGRGGAAGAAAAPPAFGLGRLDDRFTVISLVTIAVLPLLAPIFATGDGLPARGDLWSGLDVRRLRRGEAPSGALYAVLLGALCFAVLWLGAPAAAHGRVLLLAGVVGAALFCFAALGLLLSAVFENRWGALALTACAMLLLFLLPLTAGAGYERGQPGRWWHNALYVTPVMAAGQLSQPGDERETWRTLPPLAFGRMPFYAVTPVLYTVVGVGLLGGAAVIHAARHNRRRRGQVIAAAGPAVGATPP